MTTTILHGDNRHILPTLPACSVQTVVTSPPYFGLRDYGADGQIGLEATPAEYVAALVAVFREVRRVLRDDGVMWLNLGDSYSAASMTPHGGERKDRDQGGMSGLVRKPPPGLGEKQLLGIPWRVAFALQDDGWVLRSDIIWSKPNAMPESVKDRPTKAHEYLFLFAKSPRYYYNAEAIAEPVKPESIERVKYGLDTDRQRNFPGAPQTLRMGEGQQMVSANGLRNRRSVWSVATRPYSGAHFAVMPEALVEPCILAGSRPGDVVLDPFGGSGTVARVAERLQRDAVLIELNPSYIELAERRTDGVQVSLLTEGY